MARPRQHNTEMATFNAYLPKSFVAAIKQVAQERGCSASEIVRDAIYVDFEGLINDIEAEQSKDANQMEMELDG